MSNIKRRTIKRTLSGQRLWFRKDRANPLYINIYNESHCRASALVGCIKADSLFDAHGNYFYESL